jgi:hypothetical protein
VTRFPSTIRRGSGCTPTHPPSSRKSTTSAGTAPI